MQTLRAARLLKGKQHDAVRELTGNSSDKKRSGFKCQLTDGSGGAFP